MSGIIFYKSQKLREIVDFYTKKVQAELWLDQGKCVILKHGNMLFGFCEGNETESCGIITFFYSSAGEVNALYEKMQDFAEHPPRKNSQFRIYHFFARDPEGRKIEFQTFQHRLDEFMTGSELLLRRRSIREFSEEAVSEEQFLKVMDLCSFSPTSRNSQAYYYVVTKDRNKMEALADIREGASRPLSAAPLLIAVCTETQKTKRPVQDACIAAYHLLLAAAQFGLGTCWVTDMDRPEVKEILNIQSGDYVACLTPLGYPLTDFQKATEEQLKKSSQKTILPRRRSVQEIFRYV